MTHTLVYSNMTHVLCSSTPQDVETYDPILNPVLNREVRRTGGRVLITLGDQDIDLSPAFTIFLSTRDPSVSGGQFSCSIRRMKSAQLFQPEKENRLK